MKLFSILLLPLLINGQHPPHINMGKASKKSSTQSVPRTTPLPQLGQSFFNFPTIKIPDFTIPNIPTIPTFSYPFTTLSRTRPTTTTPITTPITTTPITSLLTSTSTSTSTSTITTNSTNNGIVAESTKLLFLIGVFFGLIFLAVFIVLMKKRRNRNRNLNNGIINQNYEEKLNPNNLNNDNPPTRRSIFDAVYEEPTTFNESYESHYQSQNPIYEESF